jgi:hypothetical protein
MSDKKKKAKMGAPTKYKPEYCQGIVDYFTRELTKIITKEKLNKDGDVVQVSETVAEDLPLFEGYAASIGVHRETLLNWTQKHSDFFDAYKKAKDLQLQMLLLNGLGGHYQSAFGIFALKNLHNWTDRQESKINANVTLEDLVHKSFKGDDE